VDFAQGFDTVISDFRFQWAATKTVPKISQGRTRMARRQAGKWVGLFLGCLVVAVMIFMMFAVLGGLLSGEQ
jgi:hypothetical protein